jgi:hypothetical protein
MVYTPYQRKNPGDVLKLQDWLEIQKRVKEELREHRHLGSEQDGDVAPEAIGPRIDRGAFAPGAITAGKLAPGSIGEVALAAGAIRAVHFDPDERLPESYVRFRAQGGHDHDGVRSRALPANVAATRHIQDGAIAEQHLQGALVDKELSAEEETYARGRGFTPGNLLRAARQLMEHTRMENRPLLLPGDYQGIEGTSILIRGFLLDRLLSDGSSGDYLWIEFAVPGTSAVTRTAAHVLDARRLRATVPPLGAIATPARVRVVNGAGTEALPLTPITNAITVTYQPAS